MVTDSLNSEAPQIYTFVCKHIFINTKGQAKNPSRPIFHRPPIGQEVDAHFREFSKQVLEEAGARNLSRHGLVHRQTMAGKKCITVRHVESEAPLQYLPGCCGKPVPFRQDYFQSIF
jgi:hypothetical protein